MLSKPISPPFSPPTDISFTLFNDSIKSLEASILSLATTDKNKTGGSTLIANTLSAYTPDHLYAFYQSSKIIANFCKTDSEFQQKLSEAKHYKNAYMILLDEKVKNLESVDKKIVLPPFDQFLGNYLFDKATQCKDAEQPTSYLEFLNQACEQNCFLALEKRMRNNLTHLETILKGEAIPVPPIIEQLLSDAHKMGNIYRALGHFSAAETLLMATILYAQLEPVKLSIERYDNVIKTPRNLQGVVVRPPEIITLEELVKQTMEHYYLVFLSSPIRLSISLNNALNHGKDLLISMPEQLKTIETAQPFFNTYLSSATNLNVAHLFARAKSDAETEVKLHPTEYSPLPSA